MFFPSADESHSILDVLEEICFLNGQIFVHDLEELPVGEDVRGAHLDCHPTQLVHGRLAGVVVEAGAGGQSWPHSVSDAHKHPLNHSHSVMTQRMILKNSKSDKVFVLRSRYLPDFGTEVSPLDDQRTSELCLHKTPIFARTSVLLSSGSCRGPQLQWKLLTDRAETCGPISTQDNCWGCPCN